MYVLLFFRIKLRIIKKIMRIFATTNETGSCFNRANTRVAKWGRL